MPKEASLLVLAVVALCLAGEARVRAADDIEQFARGVLVESGQTTGDVVCFFCSVRVRGVVDGDVVAIGGGVELEGSVTGDVVVPGGGVRLGPRAKVGGEVVALGGPVEEQAGATVKGTVEFTPWAYFPGQRQLFLPSVITLLGSNVGLLAIAVLILRRRRVEVMAEVARRRFVLTTALGVALLALLVILLELCNYAGRVQPVLALITVGVFGVAALVGGAGVSLRAGSVLPNVESWWRRALAGTVLLAGLQLIPIMGMVVFVVLAIIAPGIATRSGFGSAEDWLPRLLSRRRGLVPPAENQRSGG